MALFRDPGFALFMVGVLVVIVRFVRPLQARLRRGRPETKPSLWEGVGIVSLTYIAGFAGLSTGSAVVAVSCGVLAVCAASLARAWRTGRRGPADEPATLRALPGAADGEREHDQRVGS